MTALEIASKIRNGEITVQEAVETCISAIEEVNPKINAVVETRYERAREEAQKKDELLSKMSSEEKKKLPPLFGVPFTCKEMLSNEGMRCTLGSVHRKDRTFSVDATVVKRIKAAGAILVGTTNVPEIGFWFECDNIVYGESRNPYDTNRTPGGSSGGEGAIIGAGASPFGIGSDIGGSIRLPAAFCGIFGHKPSDRVIPMTGHEPVFETNASEMVGKRYPFTVLGPLARSVDDLVTLFQLMMGPDGIDQNIKTDFQLKPLIQNAEEIKVYFLPSPVIHGASETEADLVQSVKHAARYLQEMGAETSEADRRLFVRGFDIWTARVWSMEGRDFSGFLSNEQGVSYFAELTKLFIKKNKYTFPALMTGFLDRFARDASQQEANVEELQALKKKLTKMLGKNGVIIMPAHPRKAPKLRSTYTRPFDFAYTAVINALGFPSTAVPMGLSNDHIPLAVQVIAAEDQDHLCLSVAKMLETGFGGWRVPFTISGSQRSRNDS